MSDNNIELHYCKNLAGPKAFLLDNKEVNYIIKNNKDKKFGGIFHSHPISDIEPSENDIKFARSNKIMMIYDVCDRELALYRIKKIKGKKKSILLQKFTTGFY